ncbi:MAG: acyl-CoA thioesterase [Planctomyces sp.]|nr:acyl-CoA thioesterase [Planctomyces sp.]
MPLHVSRRRVQFSETDMAGIVHFANFYRWMEEAEHDYFRSLGLRIMEPRDDGNMLGWPRVSASCNYVAPAKYEDEIDVRLDVERVGLRSVSYVFEFVRGEQTLARGRMKSACCICRPDGTLTSVDLPERHRELIRESAPAARAGDATSESAA